MEVIGKKLIAKSRGSGSATSRQAGQDQYMSAGGAALKRMLRENGILEST
jgi:hypothetical protein